MAKNTYSQPPSPEPALSFDDSLDTHTIKQRSVSGALAFVTRTFLLQGIGAFAFAVLAGLLTTEQIGIFIIVDATVSFLVYFSDIGLAAALIQKKTKLTKADLATTFTIQQLLVLSLVILAFIFTDQISSFYDYGPQARGLYQALVVSFFLSSLKTIPSILLERELEFDKLVIPQIIENLVFYGLVVYLAWQGQGVSSYTYAVLARGFVGLIVIYLLKPWLPRFGLDLSVAKSLITFGAPFQLNSILALFKDRLLIIFLGRILGPGPVGLLGWAEKWAQLPIRFFADPVLRVTFPAYARLQDHKHELKKAIEKSIFFVSFLVFPSVFGMIAISQSLVTYIPAYSQWQPALPALALYGINTMFAAISITLTNTLNATGRVKTTLKLMIMWTVLTWTLTPVMIHYFGFTGAALASALTASSSLVGYYYVRRLVNIDLFRHLRAPLLSSFLMFIAVRYIAAHFATSLLNTLIVALVGAIIYACIITLIARRDLLAELKIIKKYLPKPK